VTKLERAAERWIEPYWNAQHLVRTRDRALELEGDASEAIRLAALTHDIERHFPGGPRFDPLTMAPDDEAYNREHSERSARIVAGWLRDQGAEGPLVADVQELVLRHEWGGSPSADVVQAADSLSFLEINARPVVVKWLREGRATPDGARAKVDWMLDRIRVPRARELARPLHARALEALEEEVAASR
jgi:hypothetical protein